MKFIQITDGVKATCKTKSASISYRIVNAGASKKTEMHTVQTRDFGFAFKHDLI